MRPDAFPILLTVLDVMACLTYACARDGWRAGYWLAAAFLTYSTTRIGR